MAITIPILRSKSDRHRFGMVIGMARNPQMVLFFEIFLARINGNVPIADVDGEGANAIQ